MKSLLVIIDLQKQFINQNTEFLLNEINSLIKETKFNEVVFTRFVNSKDNILFKNLNYKGCITEESKKIEIDTENYKVIDKDIYSILTNEFKEYIISNNISKIYLCGIDTECCVLKSALDLFENGYDVYVLKDYCACTHGLDMHNNAIRIIQRNIGNERVV